MGILDNIGKGKLKPPGGLAKRGAAQGSPAAGDGASRAGARAKGGAAGSSVSRSGSGTPRPAGSKPPGTTGGAGRPGSKPGPKAGGKAGSKPGSRLPGRKRRKGGAPSAKERIASAASPLHDRRRRLVGARETTLRDLGGLMLEMYKRNRFREELLLDKCEEVLAIEVEIAHVDQRLFQLAPPNAAGMRPIGRCECDAPIYPGQNFCGVCGRSFATLTQGRSCTRCGAGLRPGDHFCPSCGTEAPDALQTIEAAPSSRGAQSVTARDAASIATSAVAETVIIEAPSIGTPAGPSDTVTLTDLPPAVEPPPSLDESLDAPPSVVASSADASADAPPLTAAALSDPAPAPAGFDWSAPPAAPDVAMDAALDALPPSSPTDPGTPFAGFPLTSTVPPPPIADPADAATPVQPAPIAMPDVLPPPVVDVTPVATPEAPATQAAPAEPAAPATPGAAPTQVGGDDKAAKAALRAQAKAQAKAEKQRAHAAKARAKERAKAAREARKRGGGE